MTTPGRHAGRDTGARQPARSTVRLSEPSSRRARPSQPRAEQPVPVQVVPASTAKIGATIKTPVGNAPVVPVVLILIGGYLAWFGAHYWKTDVKWPTTPIKDVLQGKGLPAATATLSSDEQAVEAAAQAQLTGQQGVTPGTGTTPSSSAVGQAVASGAAPNQNIGKMLAASYGWSTGAEWDALVQLWDRESGWDNTVWNGGSHAATQPASSSGAYGIPQALPYSKMPKAAWPAGYGGTADPTSQISWGLAYIKATYGDPVAANNFDAAHAGY